MDQTELAECLSNWVTVRTKTIKRLALFVGYTAAYLHMIKNGSRRAGPRVIENIVQAMQQIDEITPPPTEKRYVTDTPRNLARAAGLKRYEGDPCPTCGHVTRYVSGCQCVNCLLNLKRWRSA
jgi:hypothetical protein